VRSNGCQVVPSKLGFHGESEQKLRELATRERKTRDKWLSLKKRLRTNKRLAPEVADETYRAAEATFDRAMKMLEDRREKLLANAHLARNPKFES